MGGDGWLRCGCILDDTSTDIAPRALAARPDPLSHQPAYLPPHLSLVPLTRRIDVFLSAFKLVATYRSLSARRAALSTSGEVRGSETQGYALTDKKDSEEATKLAADYKAWKQAAWVNLWVSRLGDAVHEVEAFVDAETEPVRWGT